MIVYLIRRVINYAILTAVAASLAYVLASIGLKPVAALESRHPRPPAVGHRHDSRQAGSQSRRAADRAHLGVVHEPVPR